LLFAFRGRNKIDKSAEIKRPNRYYIAASRSGMPARNAIGYTAAYHPFETTPQDHNSRIVIINVTKLRIDVDCRAALPAG
jgi:hypothetical protein